MVTATFRFYEELNDFLPRERRGNTFAVPCVRVFWKGSHHKRMAAMLELA